MKAHEESYHHDSNDEGPLHRLMVGTEGDAVILTDREYQAVRDIILREVGSDHATALRIIAHDKAGDGPRPKGKAEATAWDHVQIARKAIGWGLVGGGG